jgi:glycosyltransferase involved in cell wall biosynthesis
MKKNIWYIHPYSGSPSYGMSFRPYYMAKYFNIEGYDTTIISSLYHHLSNFPDSVEGLNIIDNIEYYLVPTNKYKGNGVHRVVNMLSFGLNLFKKNFRKFANQRRPDIIIASSAHPFHIFAAHYYAKKFNAKLIFEVRDLWPLSLIELVGISQFHPLSVLTDLAQKYGYKVCDQCVSLLPNALSYMKTKGLQENKYHVIPNGIDSAIDEAYSENDIFKGLAEDLKRYSLVIGYTGAHGVPNNLMPLLQAINILNSKEIACVLIGEGSEKERLIQYKDTHNLNNVYFVDYIKKKYIGQFIQLCDCMFINAIPKDIYKYGISPNKIFDYLFYNKLILNGIDSPNNPIEKAGVEIKFKGDSPESLALAINTLLDKKRRGEPINSVDTCKFVIDNYSYSRLVRNYISIFERV